MRTVKANHISSFKLNYYHYNFQLTCSKIRRDRVKSLAKKFLTLPLLIYFHTVISVIRSFRYVLRRRSTAEIVYITFFEVVILLFVFTSLFILKRYLSFILGKKGENKLTGELRFPEYAVYPND